MSGGPVGTWSAQVDRPHGTSPATLHFAPDGRAFLLSGGTGHWVEEPDGGLRFSIAEVVVDDDGGFGGWIDIGQRGRRQGPAFTSSGVSVVRDANGDEAYRADVSVRARRSR